jgi:hypothetical protein
MVLVVRMYAGVKLRIFNSFNKECELLQGWVVLGVLPGDSDGIKEKCYEYNKI